MQKGVVRKALMNAAKPIAEAARENAPVSKRRGNRPENKIAYLKNSIGVSTKLIPSQRRGRVLDRSRVEVYMGSTAPHAHLVEFGTQARYRGMKSVRRGGTTRKGIKKWGVRRTEWQATGNKISSTGTMPAKPFLRIAWEAGKMNALSAFGDEMWKELLKAVRRLRKKAERGTLGRAQSRGLAS